MKGEKRPKADAGTADAVLDKLAEYGERFMAMFDDDDDRKAAKASTSGRGATRQSKQSAQAVKGGGGRITTSASPRDAKTEAKEGPTSQTKQPRSKKQHQQIPSQAAGSPAATAAAGAAVANGSGSRKRSAGAADEIDAIMKAGRKKAKRAAAGGTAAEGGRMGKQGLAASASAAAAAAAATAAQEAAAAEALRRERKLFMSHKASKVHEAVQAPAAAARGGRGAKLAAAAAEDESGLSPEEFQKLQLEIEKFASTALDKKGAKAYKARMLARLGAKADTAPRTAASIGKGMARVAAKRQARALEEAIETGMVQRKGMGKKKRADRAKNRDRGLMEAGPGFKNGVLRVKPLQKTRVESGKLRLPKGVL
ncbi:hypothetical protein Agub_g1480 [Astrephomene gubernaculifera]|uniref:Uncharacterized protein n=1 Tax=Astrephomene gubernaculifera TaxID=47775 RepID=A0AAD3HHS1_9CHLO|nr:hypothetical protein Agub_g1480 [Astrephomene gubernaculifera]